MQSLPGRAGARGVGQRPGANGVCRVQRDQLLSQTGVCVECPAPNVVSPDHMRCSPSSPGEQPNADRDMCLRCDSLPGLFVSSDGSSCSSCDGTNVVNDARTTCLACIAGTGPNHNRTRCIPCLGTTFSQVGVCNDCSGDSVVNADRTTCMPCPAGDGPNANRDGCVPCQNPFYSPFGVCVECMPPAIAIMGNTFCSETVCRPGTVCPEGATCNVEADCDSCVIGAVGLGGSCDNCTLDGSVANPQQSACEQCLPSKQPELSRSACSDCSFNMYSTFGYACDACPLPSVVNSDRTACSRFSPGQGSTGGTNTSDWLCTPCTGTDYSPAGECTSCDLPYIISTDHRSCSPCSAGFGPAADGFSCSPCVLSNYSTRGQCQECILPKVVNADKTGCALPFRCHAGSECPAAITLAGGCTLFSQCVDCVVGNVSKGNEACYACDGQGEAETLDRTVCMSCGAGQAPAANRS